MVKVADPSFLGFCIQSGVECSNKVTKKVIPTEAVGVMCEREGKTSVIEYSEIPKELSEAKDPKTGDLLFNGANIAIHYFTVEFLKKMAVHHLPYVFFLSFLN